MTLKEIIYYFFFFIIIIEGNIEKYRRKNIEENIMEEE